MKKLVIGVVGTRGFPNIQGGVEKHCEELYTRIAEANNDVEVYIFRRKAYVKPSASNTINKNIHFIDIAAPQKQSLEAIVHTYKSVWRARKLHIDILHFHNIGPGLFIPLARSLGMKTVITYHSQNYLHNKWGFFAKFILRISEWCSLTRSNAVIFISKIMMQKMTQRYKLLNAHYIPNGVSISSKIDNEGKYLSKLGLSTGKYILSVGRFTEEKGHKDLLKAFLQIEDKQGYKLVLAGDSDIPTPYSETMKKEAKQNGIVLTGYINGSELSEIYKNAGLFVLPSYHEGLPLALLEAMSYKRKVLASGIEANKEIGLPADNYFKVGDVGHLKEKLEDFFSSPTISNYDYSAILSKFNWDNAAKSTLEVYADIKN